MIKITTPNEHFNGIRAGLQFRNGVATTEELTTEQRRALVRLGYAIDEPPQAPLAPSDMTVAQLRELAAEEGIDLGEAKKKAEILAVIEAARATEPEGDSDEEPSGENDGDETEEDGDEAEGDSDEE